VLGTTRFQSTLLVVEYDGRRRFSSANKCVDDQENGKQVEMTREDYRRRADRWLVEHPICNLLTVKSHAVPTSNVCERYAE
jgi:hypothetical protein